MKSKLAVILSLGLFLGVSFISLNLGSFKLSIQEILQLIFGGVVSEQAYLVFFSFRLPRLVLAALVGGSLALAGYIIQTLARNPIADVGLLGINSGATFGSVVYFFAVGSYFSEISKIQYASLILFAMVGACLAIFLNLFLSYQSSQLHMTRFLLNGIGISLGFSALTTYVSLKIQPDDYDRVNQWIEGSIASASWETTQKIIPIVLGCFLLVVLTAKRLTVLRFRDVQLVNVGFPTGRWRIFYLLVAAILVSATVFVAGNVSFVSLLVPHVTLLYLERRSRLFLPILFINGMTVTIFADLLAKNLFAPNEIPLNAIMGVIGIPYIIGLYLKSRREKKHAASEAI